MTASDKPLANRHALASRARSMQEIRRLSAAIESIRRQFARMSEPLGLALWSRDRMASPSHIVADASTIADAVEPAEQLVPDAPGLWWRSRMVHSDRPGEWHVVEVFEWDDGLGLRTASGPISDLLPEIKWGGRAIPPAIDPTPE